MEISAPKEWFALFDVLAEEKGMAILLGGTDTGKTTLANFLILNLCRRGSKVALVDADIGQSSLGPPATIGLAVFKSDPDWEVVLSPPEIFFVGSTTPEGHFPLYLKGIKRMVDKAISYATDLILVDTTGFVSGEAGRELKRKKIDLISPRFILAL
jgi:polynucleotide 5'-hydroxyl-kinase GRC3/NOL9